MITPRFLAINTTVPWFQSIWGYVEVNRWAKCVGTEKSPMMVVKIVIWTFDWALCGTIKEWKCCTIQCKLLLLNQFTLEGHWQSQVTQEVTFNSICAFKCNSRQGNLHFNPDTWQRINTPTDQWLYCRGTLQKGGLGIWPVLLYSISESFCVA